MFDGKYLEWNQRRIKGIIDFYGPKFIYFKRVLDIGCGQADICGALYRLGADVTALDARQEHLKVAGKKFPGIKTVKADLDREWPYVGKSFDMILDLGLVCHIRDYEAHLRSVCASTTHLILETAVCDSDDPFKCITSTENKNIFDLSVNGVSSRPSAAAIERILAECGMNFKRLDDAKFNCGNYVYNWVPQNTDDCSIYKRRIWFCVKNSSPMQFAKPAAPTVFTPPFPTTNKGLVADPTPIPASNPASPVLPIMASNVAPSGEKSRGVPEFNTGDKRFVVIIPSYNNSRWCVQNINSAINQNYDKFRVIFTDDMSSDDTFEKVSQTVAASGKANKVTLIKNTNRKGALANLYDMIHSCYDDEIVLTLDGDDWFPDPNVLNRLNQIYSSRDVWITYGQYKNSTDGGHGVAAPYPPNIVAHNAYRQYTWGASHLRTFYAWLFKKIKKEDLQQNGTFFPMTWDFAIMFPMLEMAGDHSQYVPDILYVYNLDNPINDHKVNQALQQSLDRHIRGLPQYSRVGKPPPPKPAVGLMIIATHKYHRFIQGLISSADKYFLNNDYSVTYYVFSDNTHEINSNRNVVQIHIDHKPFPFASMDRFKHFVNNAEKFSREDYLYYIDVDSLFVDNVSTEILGNLVGVRHCGFVNEFGPYEHNPKSVFYVNADYPKKYKYYFGGGFSGGRRQNYLDLAQWCSTMIDQDIANGIMPIWHDETAINRYFLDHEPDVVLTPSYHYPQNNVNYYEERWRPHQFRAKIILLDKNHGEVRG